MKAALHKHLIVLAKKLVRNTKKTGEDFETETIHELRTGYKKLRALLRWQQVKKKEYDHFKEVYHRAGQLRSIQLVPGMLEKEEAIAPAFYDWLSVKLKQAKKEWQENHPKKEAKRLLQNMRKLKFNYAKHRQFFRDNINDVQALVGNTVVPDEDIHECRKMMKDMQYVTACCKKKKLHSGKLEKKIPVKHLEKLTDAIGEYNDKRMLCQLLTEYNNNIQIISHENVLARWQDEKAAAKKKIVKRIRETRFWRTLEAPASK